ncbi:DEAD/DEAH box helicase [Leucothrix pacifica]|uniref:ATP-dependent RNA helicase RhlB n=1 Tax=Leucothrix pacifica TaxID=1247513 RepID=A0A317C2H3_9GAMM|nr:DEAD/DEAH box helicase [Leucothrix pacifica]PWQ92748.1 RNA helicase [Leucothrix pacifica]
MTNTTHLSDVRFSDLGLLPVIEKAVEKTGFEFCTPIQAESLPISLAGKDVAGLAQTGTGKTAAFMLAVIQHLLSNPLENHEARHVRTLIMVPTRELAIQVAKDAEVFTNESGLKIALAYGGTGYEKQKNAIAAGADILIGTPGRLIDFYKQKLYSLRRCQCLVLDEADRMFDLGFIKDIRFLMRRLPNPEKRLNMLFSATLSSRVLELAYEHMNNPQKVEIKADTKSADRVEQWVYYPSNDEKIPLLIGLIQKLGPKRCIVFVNTKRNAENIDDFMRGNGIDAVMISGDVKQNKRQRYLSEFEQGKHQVLIATDVAARGLHIDDVTHVFNFDLPQSEEDYVHRIGRTARAGASGESHSFACEDTAFYLPDIEKYIGAKIPMADVTSDLLPELNKPKRVQRDRVQGHNKAKSGKSGHGHNRSRSGGSKSDKQPSGAKKTRGPRRRRKPSTPKTDG